MIDINLLKDIATEAALKAGGIIQEYMKREVGVEIKTTGTSLASNVLTVVDKKCEEAILSHLSSSCEQFDLAILSEETSDDGQRFAKEYFWCVDPMDGTLAFINNYPGFSVSIALVSRTGTPMIGVVYDPSTETLYQAVKDQGVFKNGETWKIHNENPFLSYVSDRKLEDTPNADQIESELKQMLIANNLNGLKIIEGAGAVLNGIRVLENGPAVMFKYPKEELGGGSIWDYAAIACIFNELGLPARNYNGGSLDLNRQAGTFMNEEGIYFSNFD